MAENIENIEMHVYTAHQSYKLNEASIATKSNIKHKIIDDFQEETGPVIAGTCYLLPRRL